jgi:hypothetical protein
VLPSCDLLVERISRITLFISRTRVGGIGRRVDRGVEFHPLPPVSGAISASGCARGGLTLWREPPPGCGCAPLACGKGC